MEEGGGWEGYSFGFLRKSVLQKKAEVQELDA